MKRALPRRYGRAMAHGFKVGDSVEMASPYGSVMGVVREVSPRRVLVWTGTTGFGQKRWPFDEKGAPVGLTKIAHPDLHLVAVGEAP